MNVCPTIAGYHTEWDTGVKEDEVTDQRMRPLGTVAVVDVLSLRWHR